MSHQANDALATLIQDQARDYREELVGLRRQLHRHPETAYCEERTASLVAARLAHCGLEVRTGVGKTGVVGLLRGNQRGRVIGIRVDMDALPLEDRKSCDYASQIPGVGHLCGHDGHVAMGLVTARILSLLRDEIPGSVKFLFQPAEESLDSHCPSGALAMIADGALENPALHALLGIHLWPEMPVGEVALRPGVILSGLDLFQVRVTGKGSHTARCDLGVDAILVASNIVVALQSMVSREADPSRPLNLNIGRIEGGKAPNTLAEEVIMWGSVRSSDPREGEELAERIERIGGWIARALRAEASLDYRRFLPPVRNDPALTELVEETARAMFSPQQVIRLGLPRLAGDDFAYMAQLVPACYIFLGAGNPAKGIVHPSHHPLFDLDEDCLVTGVALLSLAALRYLGLPDQQGRFEGPARRSI
jgi:amidohydrolase